MGIYLSAPSTELSSEEGSGNGLKFVVGEVQGWRKNMEDAHIALADLREVMDDDSEDEKSVEGGTSAASEKPKMSLFAVFDGHGGKEVAKFARRYYSQVLVELDSFKAGNYELALKESFHKLDETLEDPHYDPILKEMRSIPNPSDAVAEWGANNNMRRHPQFDSDDEEDRGEQQGGQVAASSDNSSSGDSSSSSVSSAAQTRNGSSIVSSSAVTTRPKIVVRKRNMEHDHFPPLSVRKRREEGDKLFGVDGKPLIGPNGAVAAPASASAWSTGLSSSDPLRALNGGGGSGSLSTDEAIKLITSLLDSAQSKKTVTPKAVAAAAGEIGSVDGKLADKDEQDEKGEKDEKDNSSDRKSANSAKKDGESEGSEDGGANDLIKVEKAILDLSIDEKSEEKDDGTDKKSEKNSDIEGGGESSEAQKSNNNNDNTNDNSNNNSSGSNIRVLAKSNSFNGTLRGRAHLMKPGEPSPASITLPSGGVVCNLGDHRVQAGCTAVVAFRYEDKLFVANAGDSRGVLCRNGGVAYALSEDHKPQQDTEMKRITSAGGFVNAVGRINGNLNLSRSLGDLKYKQLYHLPVEEQIISGDPDISVTTLLDTDRFFFLACDGVWDCMSNQEAVDFVSKRLDQGMAVDEIVADVFKKCVAADPRQSGGIGGDNMTCMIVLLNQQD